ncbi:ABC transporter ATP-binding protein [Methylotenera sp. 1P/1]|uniref:ABC transporter ATP-binding protein n=1 Tax=Methylotenera sp. 1P/1 TaxID=1131551 RepID=UPI00037F7486|nr:ABC transporter ATP-binding protein [Methylotenera sp. 1P/1]
MFRWFENLVNPFPEQVISTPPKQFWAFVWSCTQGMRPFILGMTLLTALIGAFEALLFAMMGKVVDTLSHIAPKDLWHQHLHDLLVLAGILLFSTAVIWIQTLLKHQTLAGNFPMRLRWSFHRLMLGQSMSFYQDEFAGRVSAKVMQTALAVRDVWFIVSDIMVYVVIYFVTIVTVVGGFSLLIVWPFLIWLALYIGALTYFIPRLAKVSQRQADARALMTGRITDAYTNISTVKLFSHAGREANYAKSAMDEFLSTVKKQMQMVSSVETINHFLNMLLIIGCGGMALWLWTQGKVGMGAVAAITAMCLRLNGISHWVMWEMTSLYEQIGTVQDGINTLSAMHKVQDAPNAKTIDVKRGEIVFDDVHFGYESQPYLLEAFNLCINAGERVGLVGRSGAGKSTLVNLLLRFYDIQSGQILIDGQNIQQVTQNSLRANVGMVTQDTSLLHRSVRDNILYGRPDANEHDMMEAAKRAEAHDFILTLRDAKGRTGYDAHVGERGVKLSGGQRQRIAIARVMLKDAPILLLDEATSALDSEVELAIQSHLDQLMDHKTVVAIAHRLSTIAAMDRLIVLDAGKVVEQGSHTELLALNGVYAKLWAHQSGGFLLD